MIVNGQSYGIGIMTYSKRIDFIKQLLIDIRSQSDEIPIYLAVNCDYNEPFNENYRRTILELVNSHPYVYVTFYLKFRGSSKLWNDMIVNTSFDNLIIINDDVRLLNNFIHDFINYKVNVLNSNKITKVNNGWACFCVNKNYIKSAGFFNEHYIGIGFEDAEFVRRNGDFPSYHTTDFVDLNFEAWNTFPTFNNSQTHKLYSNYNHRLLHTIDHGTNINYRPYEDIYDKDFNKIFQE